MTSPAGTAAVPAAPDAMPDGTGADGTGADGTGADAADRWAADRPLHADGLLAAGVDAELLVSADVHVARTLGRLAGETDERVLLAAALAVRGVREGATCVRLEDTAADAPGAVAGSLASPALEDWREALSRSPLVAVLDAAGEPPPEVEGALRPLVLDGTTLLLDRTWAQEREVAAALDGRACRPAPAVEPSELRQALDSVVPTDSTLAEPVAADGSRPDEEPAAPDVDRQRLAVAVAVLRRTAVVTGGPGTGKTTTVARVLRALAALGVPPDRVALAAPTGRAAARLAEAVTRAGGGGDAAAPDAAGPVTAGPATASTLHRLLRLRPDGSSGLAGAHLPYDAVVVDETSMVSLSLLASLLRALPGGARLLLVGDPDQLSSVEAGAVLRDLVDRRPPVGAAGAPDPEVLVRLVPGLSPEAASEVAATGVVELTRGHRFAGTLDALARAVRGGRGDDVLDLLRGSPPDAGGHRPCELLDPAGHPLLGPDGAAWTRLRDEVVRAGVARVRHARAGGGAEAVACLARHRVLCGHRRGPAGVSTWAARVEGWEREAARVTVPPARLVAGPLVPGHPQRRRVRAVQR